MSKSKQGTRGGKTNILPQIRTLLNNQMPTPLLNYCYKVLHEKYQQDLKFVNSVDNFYYQSIHKHMLIVDLNYEYYKAAITFLPNGINEVAEALCTRW